MPDISTETPSLPKNRNEKQLDATRAQRAREDKLQRPARLSPTYGDGSAREEPVFGLSLDCRKRIDEGREHRAAQMAIAAKRKPATITTAGKRPTPAEAALIADAPALVIERHDGGEVINAAAIDPLDASKRGSRAIRVQSVWRPLNLYKRGRITRRQLSAAERLLEHWEAGGFDTIRGAQYGERIPSGQAPSSDVPLNQAQARRRYSDAIVRLGPTLARIVVGVAIEGRTIELTASDAAGSDMPWLPSNKRTREAAAHALLCAGLDMLGDHFGL